MKNKKIFKNPREIIFFILNDYFKKFCNLKDLINNYINDPEISNINKNFIYNISKGIVRNYLSIDFFISFFSKIKLEKIDFKILNILRLGVFQSIFLDKVPNYSIVNECVDIAKKHNSVNSGNFVNAILRKITSIENRKTVYFNKINEIKDPIRKISIFYSFPEWIIKYWVEQYDIKKTVKICKALNENPLTYFKINTLKSDAEYVYNEIKNISKCDFKKYFDSTSFSFKTNANDILKSELMKNGFIYIQDLSSQIAIKYFLAPKENESILDICSAPGGKAINSSIMMNNKGIIFAVDNNKKRLDLIKENIKRMSIDNIKVISGDVIDENNFKNIFLKDEYFLKNNINSDVIKFDKIFIDAPCSAFGTAGKNPDAKYNKKPGDIKQFKLNSLKILTNCEKYLKVGGKIVFYTCTLSKIENKEVIENFLNLFKNKYEIENINTAQIFNDLSSDLKNDTDEKINVEFNDIFEIMPYYFKSEGATVCSLIKIK
ncbi:MAG: 16S rRNA (cytosine(967)-C(5))-methyltransferase RsmB [Actinobacteria bacterium]|nr:16S rRNA (cytosine(967)-C(5))-methyltransferase RsmB [Actinomycetota bacterium]